MKVWFATYQSVMLLKGGPRTQIFQTKQGLEEAGISVTLLDNWAELKRDQVDLVHLFGANIGTYHLAREIHKLGIPFVISPIFLTRRSHGFVRSAVRLDRFARSFARGVWSDYGLIADLCLWSRAVLPNTSVEARLFEEGFGVGKDKITVVPNGVERRFLDADPALFIERYGARDCILNVGHIGPKRKNVLRLIQALEKINHPAVIIGRIEDNDYARLCLAEARKNPRLQIIETLPHESGLLASAYAACDVFALPSQFETPGIAALEAALAGAKIVITKNGGTKDYFGSYAEYVEPTSWELIHHGILTALNKPKDVALREHIRTEFLWESVAQKTLEVYRKVLC